MRVDCEGCAGCCIDWRPLSRRSLDHERRGPRPPLDDTYNLVPLTRDEVRDFVADGLGDALVPRLWRAEGDEGVEVDGIEVAAVAGRPAFFVGLRKPPKPVGPFDTDPRWLRSCVFLDPETLQCRIHGSDRYPTECADYPGHNLELDRETECERVEAEWGGDRLLDREPPEGMEGLLLGPHALGSKVFTHPDPDRLAGVVSRAASGDLTPTDRAEFVGVAVGSSPGSTTVNDARAADARDAVLAAESWAGRACEEWRDRADRAGGLGELIDRDADTPTDLVARIETDRGAPATQGWGPEP
ncbi:YkgJ family cysteine cluster protein [Salinirubrum litoreum]|uniref:YkgJ family cysteine cluster protein n=1 Tax=Salinirubrum litoreum TaxID=1126234 RepID=A0ABD5R881_9EURY|nr:YkgJ family cysteine cluster protein [Salinirubrum litoreum]